MTHVDFCPVADSLATGVQCRSLTPGSFMNVRRGGRRLRSNAAETRAGGAARKPNMETTPSVSIDSEGHLVQLLAICHVSLPVRTVLKEHAPATDDRGDRQGGPREGRGKPVKSSRGTAAPDHTSSSHT
jgi:hypothetical protein